MVSQDHATALQPGQQEQNSVSKTKQNIKKKKERKENIGHFEKRKLGLFGVEVGDVRIRSSILGKLSENYLSDTQEQMPFEQLDV